MLSGTAAAIAAGYFKKQIVPIEVKSRKGVLVLDTDEHVHAETTIETLSNMEPAYKPVPLGMIVLFV